MAGTTVGGKPEPPDLDREAEMLPRDLPPRAARATALFLIVLFVVCAVAAVALPVPETETCPFVLAPLLAADPLRSTWRGVVEAVGAVEGQTVAQGHILYRIRSSEIRTLATELAGLKREEAGTRARIENAHAEYGSQRNADAQEEARLKAKSEHLGWEIERIRGNLELRRAAAAASRKLQAATIDGLAAELPQKRQTARTYAEYMSRLEDAQKGGTVSWEEVFGRRLAKEKADADLDATVRAETMARLKLEQFDADEKVAAGQDALALVRAESECKDARSLLAKLAEETAARATAQAERERAWATELEKTALKIAGLTQELVATTADEVLVTAPYAATVLAMKSTSAGDVVERGEELCRLARTSAALQVELTVPEAAAGRIKVGMEVKLLYAAFPYQRHGVRLATVTWVSPGASGGRDGRSFRAFAQLREAEIRVDMEARPLRAGMGGEARVVVGRRTLIEYVFEPLRMLRESVR